MSYSNSSSDFFRDLHKVFHNGFTKLSVAKTMDCSTPGFPVLHYLPEFAQTHAHWVGDEQLSHPPNYIPTNQSSLFFRSSSTLFSCCLFNNSHSEKCEVIFHCGFELCFSDDSWYWTFRVPVDHLYIFGEMSVPVVCPFFNCVVCFLMSSCVSSLCILDINHLLIIDWLTLINFKSEVGFKFFIHKN